MTITYYQRYRMEYDLGCLPEPGTLPQGYRWVCWRDSLIDTHAEVKYLSFRNEIDSHVFPCLGDLRRCRRLMREIRRKPGFLPQATWLIAFGLEYCATIQGVRDRTGQGAIQNVGVVPEHRNRGLGSALVGQALRGFRAVGLPRAYLEVTAENADAVRLYRRLGFRKMKTLYKAVDL